MCPSFFPQLWSFPSENNSSWSRPINCEFSTLWSASKNVPKKYNKILFGEVKKDSLLFSRCPNNAFFLFFIWDWTNKHTAATSLFYDFCTCNLEKNNFAENASNVVCCLFFCKYKVVRQKSKVWSATVDSFAKLIYDHIMFGRHAFQLSGSRKMAKSWCENAFSSKNCLFRVLELD